MFRKIYFYVYVCESVVLSDIYSMKYILLKVYAWHAATLWRWYTLI